MNKKTALITGSSRGIGRAIAILFARNNYIRKRSTRTLRYVKEGKFKCKNIQG